MDWIIENIKALFGTAGNVSLNFPAVGIVDILDILIVAYLIYKIIEWIQKTRAWVLFKGLMVIFIFWALAVLLKLNTIVWIITKSISVGIIAVVVIFQPELRKALEQLGKGRIFSSFSLDFFMSGEDNGEKFSVKTVEEIIKGVAKMSAAKTGALILIEQKVPLGDHERTGIPIDAVVSSQLLINIFEKNTPLHDGAVIIRNNRVAAATCFLPLTESQEVSMDLGTRHRAAIGASEVSDAYVVVVSEETGAISVAKGGVLYRDITVEALRQMLQQGVGNGKKKLTLRKGRQTNE